MSCEKLKQSYRQNNKMSYGQWLQSAYKSLQNVNIPSARLDAELLLGFSIKKPRHYIIAHSEDQLSTAQLQRLKKLLKRRIDREPIAYILGYKEFYGRNFMVSPSVLIPRPESETIIKLFKQHNLTGRVLDVGTGSGCIGLTLKAEHPAINLTISDVSTSALEVARKNAKKLGIKPIRCIQSDLLEHWLLHKNPKKFDVIIANLPYVDSSWQVSPETAFEPAGALFSKESGMQHIKRLFVQTPQLLQRNGHLLIEADPRQHNKLSKYAEKSGLQPIKKEDFIVLYTYLG